jgi:hypothetical protein
MPTPDPVKLKATRETTEVSSPTAAELCAVAFEALDQAGWARRLLYPWPEPTERDLAWVARRAVHEGEHHLMDVGRVLAAMAGT